MISQTISHYRITEKLGEGGMGVVYKAEDTKLKRFVALKFLRSDVLEDEEHKERFLREAQAAAALDHPNICTVYEIDEAEGQTFLSMAFLEGQTVKEKFKERPLKLDEALDIAIQTAQGLQAAHEKAIVHRDIKSSNLMVTPQGQVKVMDFGLAQLAERSKLTKTTASLGTPSYMSPEQAQKSKTDRRTDIWSLGVVVYEMVTGRLPFEREREQAVLYSIVNEEPEVMTAQRVDVPVELDRIVGKAMAKDADERYQHVDEMRVDFQSLRKALAAGAARTPAVIPSERSGRNWSLGALTAVGLALLAIGLGLGWWLHDREAPSSQRTLHFTMPLPKEGDSEGLHFQDHLSPNGQFIAVSGVIGEGVGIFLRELDSLEWQLLPGTATGDLFWSPDSRSIAFFGNQKLKSVSIAGGPVEDIADIGPGDYHFSSGAWGRDAIVFSPSSGGGLFSVPATGEEEPRPLTTAEAGVSHRYPAFLPDGRHFLYTAQGGSSPGIYVASLDDPAGRRLLADPSSAIFARTASGRRDGYLIFTRNGRLMVQPFNAVGLEFQGDASILAERALWHNNGAAAVSASDDGILTYLGGRNRETDSRLVWFDREGNLQSVEGPTGKSAPVALSPDDRMAAVVRGQPGVNDADVWLRDLESDREDPFTFDGKTFHTANVVWSPAGDRIAYSSFSGESSEFFVNDVPASSPGRAIFRGENRGTLTDWSQDGYLVYTELHPETGADLWYLLWDGSVSEDPEPVAFLADQFDTSFGRISPDGRWIAYVSNRTGQYEVWVQQFPSGPLRFQISATLAQQPRWSRDGGKLYYVGGSAGRWTIMEAHVRTPLRPGDSPIVDPQPLFDVRVNTFAPDLGTFFYDVSLAGDRFLIDEIGGGAEPFLNVVVNWEGLLGGIR